MGPKGLRNPCDLFEDQDGKPEGSQTTDSEQVRWGLKVLDRLKHLVKALLIGLVIGPKQWLEDR